MGLIILHSIAICPGVINYQRTQTTSAIIVLVSGKEGTADNPANQPPFTRHSAVS